MFGMFNKKSAALESQLNEAKQQKETVNQALADLQVKFDAQASDLAAAHAETAKAKQDGDAAINAAKEEAQAKTTLLAEVQAQLSEKIESESKLQVLVSKAENDLAAATNQIKDTQTQLESAIQESKSLQNQMDALSNESIDLKNTIETQTSENAKLNVELEIKARQNAQDKAKQDDAEQENELLLTQLMEVQEELEVFYLDKVKFEKLYQELQVRWARLEKRYPNYVDFGSIELVTFDAISDTPSITWRASDCAQGGVVLDEFVFHTILRDGQPGISIGLNAKEPSVLDSALVPKLIKPQSKEFGRFVRTSNSDFGRIMAAAAIIAQLEASSWLGLELPQDFDLSFWRQSLKLLPAQLQALPVLLRYDAVKLKRELINPDYEHIWLELKGMGLGSRTWPKFEIRLGAAMIQRNGFSQFPKFEIPLIDGKTKPFDSWYAESQDDIGAKLELRFSLEKQVFDASVWTKLEGMDRALVLRLIYAMPDLLLRLEAEHASIHRPWATWVGFAKAAVQVIEDSRGATQTKELPATKAQAKVQPESTSSSLAKPLAPAKLVRKKTAAKKKPVAAKKAAPAKKAPLKKVAAFTKKTTASKPASKEGTPAKLVAVVKKTAIVKRGAAAKNSALN